MTVRKMCYDKILPSETNRPLRMMMIGGRLHAVFEFRKRWINGSTLTVLFMGGSQAQQDLAIEQANLWTQHANLNFDFNNAPNADIRVSFDPLDGAWSWPMFNTLSQSFLIINRLRTLIFPSGTTKCTFCEYWAQTISLLTPPGAGLIPSAL